MNEAARMPTASCIPAGSAQKGPQRPDRRARCSRRPARVRDQPLIARAVLADEHHRLADRGMAAKRSLDLAELDAEPPYFHLIVDPSQELDVSITAPSDLVARAVHVALRGDRQTDQAGIAPR